MAKKDIGQIGKRVAPTWGTLKKDNLKIANRTIRRESKILTRKEKEDFEKDSK